MPILDDEQFESYLKEFRPLPAGSLQLETKPLVRRRSLTWMAWAAACAAVLVLAFLLPLHFKPASPINSTTGLPVGPQPNSQTLTIGRANALLSHSPSFKEAVDQLSFQHQAPRPPEGKQSALDALGKENIKL